MKQRPSLSMTVVMLFSTTAGLHACEPILPMMRVLAGANWMIPSLGGLVGVILFKCTAYAMYEKTLSRGKAFGFLLVANLVTTLVGTFVAALIASPSLLLGLPLIFVVSLRPAKRLGALTEPAFLRRIPSGYFAGLVTAGLFLSFILFGATASLSGHPGWSYWFVKVAAVYSALLISIALTTFWEEYIVSRMAGSEDGRPRYFPMVLRANLLTFLVAAGIGAAMMLPRRFASPDFLVPAHNM